MNNPFYEIDSVWQLREDIMEKALRSSLNILPIYSDSHIRNAVNGYFSNTDHGFEHSQKVWERCVEIVFACPNLRKKAYCDMESDDRVFKLLMWASIFHDFSRFVEGVHFSNHELKSAEIAMIFFDLPDCADLRELIVLHDYFCPLVDGEPLPDKLMDPLAEIFRLADKTSASPADEVLRYYQTGKRLGVPFFNSDVPDDIRFDLTKSQEAGDQMAFMLMIWALQPSDFFFFETAQQYACWEKGKEKAYLEVGKLANIENVPAHEVCELVNRFLEINDIKPFVD